jgi:hypothetical protein
MHSPFNSTLSQQKVVMNAQDRDVYQILRGVRTIRKKFLRTTTVMLDRAQAAGLAFEKETRENLMLRANAVGMLYDSRKGLGGLYRYMPRKIADLCHMTDKDRRVIIKRSKIHESVIRRIALGSDRYAPIGLPGIYDVATRDGKIADADASTSTGVNSSGETPASALTRFRGQEQQVWDIVWWKRVAYFSSILIATVLLVFPLFAPYEPACQGTVWCLLAPLINAAGALVPGSAEMWVAAYRSHPGSFITLFIAFAVLLAIGKRLQVRTRDQMRHFSERSLAASAEPAEDLQPGTLFKLRTSPAYQSVSRTQDEGSALHIRARWRFGYHRCGEPFPIQRHELSRMDLF